MVLWSFCLEYIVFPLALVDRWFLRDTHKSRTALILVILLLVLQELREWLHSNCCWVSSKISVDIYGFSLVCDLLGVLGCICLSHLGKMYWTSTCWCSMYYSSATHFDPYMGFSELKQEEKTTWSPAAILESNWCDLTPTLTFIQPLLFLEICGPVHNKKLSLQVSGKLQDMMLATSTKPRIEGEDQKPKRKERKNED